MQRGGGTISRMNFGTRKLRAAIGRRIDGRLTCFLARQIQGNTESTDTPTGVNRKGSTTNQPHLAS